MYNLDNDVPEHIQEDMYSYILSDWLLRKYGHDAPYSVSELNNGIGNLNAALELRFAQSRNPTVSYTSDSRQIDLSIQTHISKFTYPVSNGYDLRLIFPSMRELNSFLAAKPEYKRLIENGIYLWKLQEDGSVYFYQSEKSDPV